MHKGPEAETHLLYSGGTKKSGRVELAGQVKDREVGKKIVKQSNSNNYCFFFFSFLAFQDSIPV